MLAKLTVSDSCHGCANQRHEWVPNNIVHPQRLLSTAEPVQNGGEPERGGGAEHGHGGNSKKLRSGSRKRVPEHLETTKSLPEHWRGSKKVGGALAAEIRTGAEDDDEEKTA